SGRTWLSLSAGSLSAASGSCGLLRGALEVLKHVLRPPLPRRGHLGDGDETAAFGAVPDVDAENVADGEVVVGLRDDLDRVAGAHVSLDDDPHVGAGAQRFGEGADERGVVHPHTQPPARDTRLGDLEDGGADRPPLADERVVDVHALGREVLAELRRCKRAPDLRLPPARVLGGVGVDGLVRTAVGLAVRLVIAGEIHAASGDAARDGRLPDGASGGAAAVLELARAADADRKDSADRRQPFPFQTPGGPIEMPYF